jgi:hypothetical protein
MQHVITLEVLKVEVLRRSVMQVIVNHVIKNIAEKLARSHYVEIGFGDDIGHWHDHKEEVYCVAWQRREHKSQAIHWESMVDAVKQEVEGEDLGVVWEPGVLRVEEEAMKIIL